MRRDLNPFHTSTRGGFELEDVHHQAKQGQHEGRYGPEFHQQTRVLLIKRRAAFHFPFTFIVHGYLSPISLAGEFIEVSTACNLRSTRSVAEGRITGQVRAIASDQMFTSAGGGASATSPADRPQRYLGNC